MRDSICLLNLNISIVNSVMTCDNLELLKILKKYKFWSQVDEHFETGTAKSLKDIEFGVEIG